MVHVKWVKELSHRPKVYFFDNGIRNAIVQRLDPSLISTERGHLFEQTVFQTLYARYGQSIRYWRTINQTEVDFVIAHSPGILAYEAKYTWEKPGRKTRSLISFETEYSNQIKDSTVIDRSTIISLFM